MRFFAQRLVIRTKVRPYFRGNAQQAESEGTLNFYSKLSKSCAKSCFLQAPT